MEAIALGDVDLNCPYNCKNHNTHFFGTDKQIVRRGQAFNFYVNFQNREWDDTRDTMSFTVETGIRPCESNGTKCNFSLGKCIDHTCWSACYKPHQKRCMNITLFPPTNACIGRHILNMHVTSCDRTYDRCLGDFYILFNPWCADDPVYMYNEAHRKEYVLNEQGMLYQGVHKHITSRPWHFGQFEDGILDICLKLLDMGANYHHDSDRESSWRNDPVHVSMVVNHMICGHSNNSIMKLPQNNDYLQRAKPLSWNGSVPILLQWYKGRCRPVRYGDSASLASVMCTVMRCLGIPSRVVTNFYSPQRAENPLVVNELFDCTGKTLRGKDSLWSYHCWNESWMARRDLNQCCGDWQCLDPTPLETGRGSICCGPTSVRSIKDGNLDLDYDGHHMFSRLNAGCVGWLSQGSVSKTKLYYDIWPCGQYISTKCIGSDLREDITRAYKYELGSLKDKEAFYRAYRKIHSGYCNAPNSDIDREVASLRNPFLSDAGIAMRLKMANCPVYGQDVCLQWVLENLRKEPKNLNFNLCAQVMTCNGCPLDQFWKDNMNVILGPREVKTIPLHIPFDQYGSHLSDYNIMRVVAVSEPECGGEVLMVNRDIVINKPPLDIKFLGKPRVHATCTAEISFCNPLQEDLRNCVLSLEGCGLFKDPKTIDLGTLAANHQARTIVEFTPYREGCHRLLANFRCHKFGYCKGYANADVESSAPQVVCGSGPQVVCGSGPQVVCGSSPQVVCGSSPQVVCGSSPQVVCGSGPQAVCGSSPQVVCGSDPQPACDYVCIPVCNSGYGPAGDSGGPLVYDYVCLPVGHPMCESVYRAAAASAPYSMSDSVSRSVCDNVSRLLGVPVSFSMSDPRSAPASHPMSAPVVQGMRGSLPTPASYPVCAPVVQGMNSSMPNPPSYAMSLQMPPAMGGSVPAPPSYAMSLQMPSAVCSSVCTPSSYSTSVPMTEAACGSMPTPVSHPTCGPVSQSVSGSECAPVSRFASQSVSPPATSSACAPVSRFAARSVCAPVSRPMARSVSIPTARSVCGSKWGPSCNSVPRSARGLASHSVWNATWVPASYSARNSTLRSAYGTLPRTEPQSTYGNLSRSVPLSAYGSLCRSDANSTYGTRSCPGPLSTYGTLSRPAPHSTYDTLSHSAPRSKYNTLSRSAWALTRAR
ncbi:unnamed protein product [Lepidochelys olivacea]